MILYSIVKQNCVTRIVARKSPNLNECFQSTQVTTNPPPAHAPRPHPSALPPVILAGLLDKTVHGTPEVRRAALLLCTPDAPAVSLWGVWMFWLRICLISISRHSTELRDGRPGCDSRQEQDFSYIHTSSIFIILVSRLTRIDITMSSIALYRT
jgi:hypothetical protein